MTWSMRATSCIGGSAPSCTTSPKSIPPSTCFAGRTSPTASSRPWTSWPTSPTPWKASCSSTPSRYRYQQQSIRSGRRPLAQPYRPHRSRGLVAVAWCGEPPPVPADGDDVLRVGRVAFDPMPEPFHVGMQVPSAPADIGAPDQLDDPLAGDRLAREAKQDPQQLEFLAGHADQLPTDLHGVCPLVQDDIPDRQDLRAERACWVGRAHHGMEGINQFWQPKRPAQDQHPMG